MTFHGFFLILWMLGEILTLIYIIIDNSLTSTFNFPLYMNYGLNILLLSYLFYAKAVYR